MAKKKGLDLEALLAEVNKRVDIKQFKIAEHCFDKQLKFINDTARFKTAVCSRRAGKTESCAADLVNTAMSGPFKNCAYITLARTSAKRIVWPVIKKIVKDYNIPCKIDNTELTIEFSTGSTIYLGGAKDLGEIEKYRGLSLRLVYIDEAASFKESILQPLIDDVLAYATLDVNGSICLIGTPGPIPSGAFYEASHSKNWSNHKWTIFDNPWIKIKSGKEPGELLAEERTRKGIDENHPTYRREAFAEWITDEDSRVYKFDASRNLYDTLPESKTLEYIIGIDTGFIDYDAIAVLAYSKYTNTVFLVEEYLKNKQGYTPLVDHIKKLVDKYKPIKSVIDPAAGGKKIQEEIRHRYGINLEVAEKTRKFEFIEFLNDDLRTSKFKAFKGSQFEEDCYKVEWDRSNPEKLKVSDRYHTDIGDAVLYGWRACRHYFTELEPKKFNVNSNEYMDWLEEQEAEKMELSKRPQTELTPDQDEFESLFNDDDNI
jgi:hypothetical protein